MITDHDFIVAVTIYLFTKSLPSFGNTGQNMQLRLDDSLKKNPNPFNSFDATLYCNIFLKWVDYNNIIVLLLSTMIGIIIINSDHKSILLSNSK